MSLAASVEGRESLRLFCALRLPGDVVGGIVDWQAGALRDGRLVSAAQLHVTLAFLGGRPAAELPSICAALEAVARPAAPPELRLNGYRETSSVGMLVFEDVGGGATAIAEGLFGGLERLGVYRRERRPWLPHVTVLRFRERPRLRPELPELGAFSPSEAAVYHSVLRPTGAQYEVLETVALGG